MLGRLRSSRQPSAWKKGAHRSTLHAARRLALLVALVVSLLPAARGQEPEGEPEIPSLLVENVHILKPGDETTKVQVNVVLRAGKLVIVTEDRVARDTVDLVVDADGGFLLGRLKVGMTASFIVLDKDPRLDFDVLLDTDTHTTLAVREGNLVRNRLLPSAPALDEEEVPKRSGWLAYTPPPVALPLDYGSGERWNAWTTDWTSGTFLVALAVDRQNWQDQDAQSESQVGNLNEFEGGEIRAFRFGAIGTLNFETPWTYTLFAATSAFDKGFDSSRDDDLILFDARLDIPVFENGVLSVGKQKEPISLERMSGGLYLPMQERSVAADGLLPARNIGVVLSGTAAADDMSWAVGVFNGWLDSGGSLSDNSTVGAFRVTGLPAYSADESNLLHLGFGARFSDTRKPGRIRTEPEFNQSPLFIDTGEFVADQSTLFDVEAAWLRGPLWVFAEYLWTDTDAPSSGDPRFSGHSVTAAWNLTGEMRSYNRRSGLFGPVPVSKGVYQGGKGVWEAAVRWSTLDANEGTLTGGDVEIYSVGLNWWLSPSLVTSVNYRWIELDRFGVEGDSHGFLARIVILLD